VRAMISRSIAPNPAPVHSPPTMKILLVRHAEAEEIPAADAKADAQRRLTDKGRKRMGQVVEGLQSIEPELDAIATSPLVRAVETAAIIGEAYDVKPIELPALSPGSKPTAVLKWLRTRREEVVALVGHEPDMGQLSSWLLARSPHSFIQFKKGGIVAIEFVDALAEGKALLRWSMTPGQLRATK
jgi:phosphohistidine phosphatase